MKIKTQFDRNGTRLNFESAEAASDFLTSGGLIVGGPAALINLQTALLSGIIENLIFGEEATTTPQQEPQQEPTPEPQQEPTETPQEEPNEPEPTPTPTATQTAVITQKKQQTMKTETTAQQVKKDPAALLSLLSEFMAPAAPTIDADQVRTMIKEELSNQQPREIVIKIADTTHTTQGGKHKDFEKLLKLTANNLPAWIYGPAGSFKSTAAEQVAEALNLPFYGVSVTAQTTETKLIGYNDANGRYVETDLYKAYKNGGVFLLDEADAGNANTLQVLNAAIANKFMFFPCGKINRHPDFRILAAANTIGSGASQEYIGKQALDGSSKDRFVFLFWGYDETLERQIAPAPEFTEEVIRLRHKAEKLKLKAIISPRASLNGGKLILSGFSTEEALQMTIFDKLDQNTQNLLKNEN